MIDVVNEDGNLRVHNRVGYAVSVFFEGDSGTPRDVTSAEIVFLSQAGNITLIQGVASNEKVLVIQPEMFTQWLNKKFEFVLRDNSLPEKPPVWSGNVIVRGW